jgi:hypothetical protein
MNCPLGRRYGDYAADDLKDQCVGSAGIMVTVSPGTTGLLYGGVQRFTANVSGTADQMVTWSVGEAGGGTIDATGLYTAPAVDGTYHVKAASHADASRTATATVNVKQLLAQVVIANAGTVTAPTGHGHQRHLIFAPDTHEWWLFYDTSTDLHSLRTRHSTDLMTWQDGASASFVEGHAGDGRDLSVAFKNLNGHDVLHATQGFMGASYGRYHVKGTITAGAISWGTPVNTNFYSSAYLPDGSATVITDDGSVIDTSGWLTTPMMPPLGCGTGDEVMFEASAKDTGTTSFDAMTYNETVVWCVPQTINARVLLPSGNTVYQLFVNGMNSTTVAQNIFFTYRDPTDVWYPIESGTMATPPASVFTSSSDMDIDDWSTVIAGGKLHAVRRIGASSDTYEHRVYDLGTGAWSFGGGIPVEAGRAASGMFLAPYGDGIVLVAIRGDTAHEVRATQYSLTLNNWTPWITVVGGTVDRTFIAGGIAEDGSQSPVVLWAQPNGATLDIAGAQLP